MTILIGVGLQKKKTAAKIDKKMPRLIIMPAGISIVRNLKSSDGIELTLGQEAVQLKSVLNAQAQNLKKVSAELSILTKLNITSEDKVVFLATDTDEGECAANANAIVAQHFFNVRVEVKRIEGFVLDNADTFVKEGLRNFFHALDGLVGEARDHGYEPIMEVAGGIKPAIPYTAIYAMLQRIPLVYVFEKTQALITLPPLPLDFDWTALEQAEKVLRKIEEDVAISPRELKGILGEGFHRLEGLFEEMEGKMTLSAFGHMLLEGLERSRQMPVMLSPSVADKLERLPSLQRQQIEMLLDRVRNPIWRAAKWHPFSGTDLDVWKPGPTSLRLAGWVEGELVYVAEIYTKHEEYERDLSSRSRNQYEPKSFKPYIPKPVPVKIEEEALEEAKGDEIVALAIQEKAKAESEREQALQMAAQYERELNQAKDQVGQLRERVGALEQEQREKRLWSLWRRLRWALFGS